VRIYLDTCSLQRPLDSRTQIRIALEAEAVLGILDLCEAHRFELVSSDVLLFETRRNPNKTRLEYALALLSSASVFVPLDRAVEDRARQLHASGIRPLDALHLASAEAIRADYFCTCDDDLRRKAQAVQGLQTRAVSPLELVREIGQWE